MSRRKLVALSAAHGEAAGKLVEIGGLLFSSTITGADPETGQFATKPEDQFDQAFRNLQALLDRAGVTTDELGVLNMMVPEPGLRGEYVSRPWLAMFPTEDRPARKVDIYPLPQGQYVQLKAVAVPGQKRQQIMMPGAAHRDPRPAAVRIGPLLFSSSISGTELATGKLIEDPHQQVRQALSNMETLVKQAGGSKDDVAHVVIYVRDQADNDDILQAWLESFPTDGDRAVRKNVFDGNLGGGTVAQLQMIAVIGRGKRRNFEVEGAAKRHPNPLGASLGDLLFSAGINGHDPAGNEVERQAAKGFDNLRALLAEAGASLDDLAQVTIVLSDYADQPSVLREWRKLFPDPGDEPARHFMAFGGRQGYQVQVHAVASLPR